MTRHATEPVLGHLALGIVLGIGAFAGGCSKTPATSSASPSAVASSPPSTSATVVNEAAPTPSVGPRATNRPANTQGVVFVAEYHHIRVGHGTMFRTPEQFRTDLATYYKLGFRPCTVSDYLDAKFPIPSGASPLVFTFDDADGSQIKFDNNGQVDPNCGVGIWRQFAKTHPDFPVRATFFVLPSMWGQPQWTAKKVALLQSLGCELGDHTITHPILRKLSDDKVKWELGTAAIDLEKWGVKSPFVFAYPYGVSPRNKSLMKGFPYQGQQIAFKAALLVGANPAVSPTSKRLEPYRIPRIQVCKGPYGMDYWLNLLEKGKVHPYVQP